MSLKEADLKGKPCKKSAHERMPGSDASLMRIPGRKPAAFLSRIKAAWIAGVIIALMLSLSACSGQEPVRLKDLSCIHETNFGGFYFSARLNEFEEAGFSLGDSVDLTFSNMHELKDVPIYNGYFNKVEEPLLVANTQYSSMKIVLNSGPDLWETLGINEKTKVTVTLREKGKYLDVQNARGLVYTDAREDYESDAVFANFREVKAGRMKPGTIFRSASPCDERHNRASYTDALMEASGIRYVVDLADPEESIEKYILDPKFFSPYWLSLYEEGLVLPANLTMDFSHKEFKQKLVNALVEMSSAEGPYLLHCTEGKDRTGCALALLEMLSGASFEELEADYMLTYANYYGITKESDPEKYRHIVERLFIPMVESITGPAGDQNAVNAGMSIGFGSVWGVEPKAKAGNAAGTGAGSEADADDDAAEMEALAAIAALTPAELEARADRYVLQNGADEAQLARLKECLTGSGN